MGFNKFLYRKEIDGLRALAVIPVIFYHSGFVGLFLFILFLYKIFVMSKSFGRVFSLGLMSFIFIYTLTSMGFISPIANYLLILLISISNYSDLNKTSKLM